MLCLLRTLPRPSQACSCSTPTCVWSTRTVSSTPPPAQLRFCSDVASSSGIRSLHTLQDADGRVTVLAPESHSHSMRHLHTLRILPPPSPTSSRVFPPSFALTFILHIRSLHCPQRARRPLQARRLRRSSRAQ